MTISIFYNYRQSFKRRCQTPAKAIYRQPPNLKSLLVKAKVDKEVEIKGCFKTHLKNCVTCQVLKETDHFYSNRGQRYNIKSNFTCTTKGVIYLINCLDCKMKYVGETGGELRTRHRGHRQEIRKENTPLGRHFGSKNTCKHFELMGIEFTGNDPKTTRLEKELKWIYNLDTLQPRGINSRDNRFT